MGINKKTIKDIDVSGKRILLRVAYDISLQEENGKWIVPDDTRIRETLPTINYLLKKGCSLILLSWLKRPDGKVVEKYRMDPVAEKLAELLNKSVIKLNDCVGPEVEKAVKEMKTGEIIMLENVRFHPEEEKEDDSFAKKLADLGELIVFDAFAQAHRVHSSTTGILKYKPAVAGLLLEKEINELSKILENPAKPFTVVLGGAKITDKLDTINNLAGIADNILIGGALANYFLKAKGFDIASSYVEETYVNSAKGEKKDYVRLAKELLNNTKNLILPVDLLAAKEIKAGVKSKAVDLSKNERIPEGWLFLDIGPATVEMFKKIISQSKTVFWNGPMGYFEIPDFAVGTKEIADAVIQSKAESVIGGGDTEKIVKMYGLEGKFTHVSTGGGASLEFLAGKKLPALEMLPNK